MKSLKPGTRGGATPIVIPARPEWHCFQSLPRYADISHSAVAEKSASYRGSKSPGRRLLCGYSVCDGVEMERRGWPDHYSANKNASSLWNRGSGTLWVSSAQFPERSLTG
jgi:hypothetical protein